MSTELTRTTAHSVTEFAAAEFADEQKALIRHTVAPTLTPPEFDLFLSLCAQYQLNPLHGEIWAAKMPGRNGEAGKFTPIVGRDGFLAIANRHPDYEGMDSDVVYSNDLLRKLPDGTYEHTFAQGPESSRGSIVGAYCVVFRTGRRPMRFYAPFSEYSSGNRAWKTNPTAMILKCAQANALRLAYNLSGLYVDAEMTQVAPAAPDGGEPDFGDDELGQRLRRAVEAMNEVSPGAYRPAKVRMLLANATDQERAAFAEALEREAAAAAEPRIPAEEPVDAEVVEPTPEEAIAEAERMAQEADTEEARAEWLAFADQLRERASAAAG